MRGDKNLIESIVDQTNNTLIFEYWLFWSNWFCCQKKESGLCEQKQTNKKQNKAKKLKVCLLKKNNQNNKNMELMMAPRDSTSWCLIFIRIFLLRALSISDGSVRQWREMRKIRGGKNKH